MTTDKSLKTTLVSLKANAKEKEYRDRPQGPARSGDFFLTYCLEKTIAGFQPTLAVSHIDGGPVTPSPGFLEAVTEVFGTPGVIWRTSYPKRGDTLLLMWKTK